MFCVYHEDRLSLFACIRFTVYPIVSCVYPILPCVYPIVSFIMSRITLRVLYVFLARNVHEERYVSLSCVLCYQLMHVLNSYGCVRQPSANVIVHAVMICFVLLKSDRRIEPARGTILTDRLPPDTNEQHHFIPRRVLALPCKA
jgi:hypothetical protein